MLIASHFAGNSTSAVTFHLSRSVIWVLVTACFAPKLYISYCFYVITPYLWLLVTSSLIGLIKFKLFFGLATSHR